MDNREATVSWFAAEKFKQQYPKVAVKSENILVDNDNIIMAGASTSFLNLGIYLIEKYYGKRLANYTAKILLINKGNVSQQSYSIFIGQKKHGDEAILATQRFIECQIHEAITVKKVIDMSALSERTFIRRFKAATGISPLEYIQRTKVEFAKKKLESGESNISQISYATGYEDLNFFRKIFKRYTGLTPSQYQKQFSF
ncbi:helix-turn-helix domain-containing protein [Phaeodactylibacter sp.]|uniref:GlxA family transcriptional regulator n=1 Tax=Phaeodactylibacter sp. TaxID=1940289 RepID=UPI0025EA813F|nr:helix-turn-helix domain-containing protein [Phaeodactylibacter sp.]MCI5056706.1 helix-turn-helix domain-containing protein [Flavobacteriales bacterium]MCI5093499.1 helix-turn-helix domain-containing protein [Phaeodactylibacter sp.]